MTDDQGLVTDFDVEVAAIDAEWGSERWNEVVAERLSRVPPRYAGAEVDHPHARDWCDSYVEGTAERGLLISGPVGVGKTHLAWAIYRAVADTSAPIEFRKLVRLLQDLRPGSEDIALTTERVTSAGLLILDDIGVQKDSEWVNGRLYEIIDTRYDRMLATIITTNRHPKKLAAPDALDERLASRIAECCERLILTGPDRRRP